jgi:PilZ domain
MNTISPEERNASGIDRRRHRRYRCSIPIILHVSDGTSYGGLSIEISESGISATTVAILVVGDLVQLEPIAGSKVNATVRHTAGRIYGFEFLNITSEQVERIRQDCQSFPVFRTSLGI